MPKFKKNEKTVETSAEKDHAQKRSKRATMYHNAAFKAFSVSLSEYTKDGSVELKDEHRLSEDALRIDMMIIKKMRGVEIKRGWGKFMRDRNILEYKSPAAPTLSLRVFDKVVHGYAGIYASQKSVKLTDMTVTIVCARKPVKLFRTLKDDFDYEILPDDDGIYYIRQRGVPVEKTLAIQIVVCAELPDSEILLKALRPGIDEATAKKVAKIIEGDAENDLSFWTEAVFKENINTLLKAGDNMRKAELEKTLREYGYYDAWRQEGKLEGWQEGKQEGWQEGKQEGWQEGILEGKRENARAMLAKSMDIDTISQITGLTVEEIAKL